MHGCGVYVYVFDGVCGGVRMGGWNVCVYASVLRTLSVLYTLFDEQCTCVRVCVWDVYMYMWLGWCICGCASGSKCMCMCVCLCAYVCVGCCVFRFVCVVWYIKLTFILK